MSPKSISSGVSSPEYRPHLSGVVAGDPRHKIYRSFGGNEGDFHGVKGQLDVLVPFAVVADPLHWSPGGDKYRCACQLAQMLTL